MDKNDAEEVHKPLGLMRAILRIKAAEVHGARGSSRTLSECLTLKVCCITLFVLTWGILF